MDYIVQVAFYPDYGFGMYVECNGPNTCSQVVRLTEQYITDILSGQDPWLTKETACTYPAPWLPEEDPEAGETRNSTAFQQPPYPNDKPKFDLEDYIGEYSNAGFGEITILLGTDDTKLFLYMGQFMEAILHYEEATDTFYTELIGKLHFLNERIPVQFSKTGKGGSFDLLHMPMRSPYDMNEAFIFSAGPKPYDDKESSELCICGCSTSNYLCFLLYFLSFALVFSYCIA